MFRENFKGPTRVPFSTKILKSFNGNTLVINPAMSERERLGA